MTNNHKYKAQKTGELITAGLIKDGVKEELLWEADRLARKLYGMTPKQGDSLMGYVKVPASITTAPVVSGVFNEQVEEAKGILSQPNAYTCQSACIAMATGRTDIMTIRKQLEAIGNPGDPAVMGKLLRESFGDRYAFDDNACLSEVRDWLKVGCFIISHFWFTSSGHVICLDGLETDSTNMSYKFSVKDPWSEFNFGTWSYDNPSVDRFDGYYSSYGIYAAGVAGQSVYDAAAIYAKKELDSMRKGMWAHVIKP